VSPHPATNEDNQELDVTDEISEMSDESTEASPAAATAGLAADAERMELLEREGDIAADYLEELLDIADLDGDLDMDVEGDRASVSIIGGDLGRLVGRNGEVLDALQELTRLAVLRATGERSRLMLDIGGHRAKRREVLEGTARDAVEKVRDTGEPVSLTPMTPFERKVVHDVVAAAGLVSDSEGVEPKRYVVIRPA
jgi:spoIIIJ-associated protein